MSRRDLQKALGVGGVIATGAVLIASLVIWGGNEPTLIIGAIVGQTSPHDQATRQGLRLAIEALDAELPEERLALEILDPADAPADTHLRALEARGVRLVIISDAGVLPPSLETSTSIVVTTDEDARLWGGPRLFCVARPAAAVAHELALWCNDLDLRRVAAVVPEGPAGDELALAFGRGLGGINDERLVRMRDPAQAGSVAAQVAALTPSADAVAFLVPAAEGLHVVRALHAAGRLPLLLSADPALPRALGTSADAILPRLRLLETADAPASAVRERVAAAWRARFATSGDPPAPALTAWDAVHALVHASRAAGGDLEKTLELMRSARLEGATGLVTFTHEGVRAPPSSSRWRFGADGGRVPWSFSTEEAAR